MLVLLTGVVIGVVWVLLTYAVTRPAVRDAALVLHAALVENPEMTVEQAESILVELQHAGVINLRLLNDTSPGDQFGNPLFIELYADSTLLSVYCMSPGIDGLCRRVRSISIDRQARPRHGFSHCMHGR